ncbi:carbohydrate kinase family protein [Nonomuraea guangzhouensis]|uniref:Carbohydrate kinase family protein n=1 Tax=Nonomuraea guangzhouensis TaxID=1291555 RepID=A0ABW4G3U7_9ACTN|nr:PfkB family carbohydrate kinase [Nonomuraea guangzhouensis]
MTEPIVPTVATVGVHIVDILARPVSHIPEGQDTALVDQIRLTAAGSAAGTAVDLVKLGNEVVSMGAIGDDELGDFLVAVMTKRGVDVSRLTRKAGEQTAASILPIRPDGGRPSFHVPGANLGVTSSDLDVALLREVRAVHLGGMDVTFGLGDPAFFSLLDSLRADGVIVTMDLLSEMPDLLGMARAFLPHVDYVLPNDSQALLMAAGLTPGVPAGDAATSGGDSPTGDATGGPATGSPGTDTTVTSTVGSTTPSAGGSVSDGAGSVGESVSEGTASVGESVSDGTASVGGSVSEGSSAAFAGGSIAEVSAAAMALLAEGPRGVLVTMGGAGSLVVTEAGVEQVPALKVEVSDTTGCGDAYCAGFITGLLHGQDVLGAARWGTAAAARVATGLGSDAGLTDLASTLALLT